LGLATANTKRFIGDHIQAYDGSESNIEIAIEL
jgi:hypothetical protein